MLSYNVFMYASILIFLCVFLSLKKILGERWSKPLMQKNQASRMGPSSREGGDLNGLGFQGMEMGFRIGLALLLFHLEHYCRTEQWNAIYKLMC